MEKTNASPLFFSVFLVATLVALSPLRAQAKDRKVPLYNRTNQDLENAIIDRVNGDLGITGDKGEANGISSDVQSRVDEMFKDLQSVQEKPVDDANSEHLVYEVSEPQLTRHTTSANKALAENEIDNVKE